MKFYRDNFSWIYWDKIQNNKLSALYCYSNIIIFFKNGKYHNNKNFAHISNTEVKEFYLNGKLYGKVYGTQNDFTKESWRKFVKSQVFL